MKTENNSIHIHSTWQNPILYWVFVNRVWLFRIHQREDFCSWTEMIKYKNCEVFKINQKFSFWNTLYRKTYDVLFSVLPPIIITSVPYVIVIKLILPCSSSPKFLHSSFSKIETIFLGDSFSSQHPPRMKTLPGLVTKSGFWISLKIKMVFGSFKRFWFQKFYNQDYWAPLYDFRLI